MTLGLVGGLLVVPATQEIGGEGRGLEPLGARWDAALGRGEDRASRSTDGRAPLTAAAAGEDAAGAGRSTQEVEPQPAGPAAEDPIAATPEAPTDATPEPEPALEESAPAGPPQQGATGPEVQEIQERLQVHGATVLADGEFGPGTDRALRTFQTEQGLEPDGVAGPATRAALLADPTPAEGATGPAGGETPSGTGGTGDTTDPGDTTAALALVNAHRATAGCPALRADDQLVRAATLHAQDMVAQGYFSHTSLDGRTFGERVLAQGYASPGGENIAAGQQSVQGVVDAWMSSEGHRANILNCDFTTMGLGRAGTTWVQVFGY
ncbi:peptidoglycan-binding protein [Oerskovia sp. Sa1BUA8]|uniref:Peptidoglycan-binding protein n=1 Tax=Oerskovia douganii TaxID=2762210 RepID=A0A9D5Z0T8_9CELL|nr:CAP domain-containing protein [Oerskovia douganii]MBE7701846.1 peptidoglycan-binding protein [Oerskovia douganii]